MPTLFQAAFKTADGMLCSWCARTTIFRGAARVLANAEPHDYRGPTACCCAAARPPARRTLAARSGSGDTEAPSAPARLLSQVHAASDAGQRISVKR